MFSSEAPVCPSYHQQLLSPAFLNCSHYNYMLTVSYFHSDPVFLETKDIKCLLPIALGHVFLGKMSVQTFCFLQLGLLLSCNSSFYILGIYIYVCIVFIF